MDYNYSMPQSTAVGEHDSAYSDSYWERIELFTRRMDESYSIRLLFWRMVLRKFDPV